MPELSIILPTCNRAALLERAILTITKTVRRDHEIIVVDGASTDSTAQVLNQAKQQLGPRLRVITESKREGFVRAANKGFRAAVGQNMLWLNDDVRPLPGAIDSAVAQLNSESTDVAFLALYHRWHSARNVAYEISLASQTYRLCHVRGTLYANFAIGRRKTFEQLDYFDERFYFYAADPDLSLKAWHAGLRIVPAHACAVDHDQHEDDRRETDASAGQADNEKLFAKWDLPAKSAHNDFNPAKPNTLKGLLQRSSVNEVSSKPLPPLYSGEGRAKGLRLHFAQ